MVFINILAFQLKISVNFLDSFAKLFYINSGTHTHFPISYCSLRLATKIMLHSMEVHTLCPSIKGRGKAIGSSRIAWATWVLVSNKQQETNTNNKTSHRKSMDLWGLSTRSDTFWDCCDYWGGGARSVGLSTDRDGSTTGRKKSQSHAAKKLRRLCKYKREE